MAWDETAVPLPAQTGDSFTGMTAAGGEQFSQGVTTGANGKTHVQLTYENTDATPTNAVNVRLYATLDSGPGGAAAVPDVGEAGETFDDVPFMAFRAGPNEVGSTPELISFTVPADVKRFRVGLLPVGQVFNASMAIVTDGIAQ